MLCKADIVYSLSLCLSVRPSVCPQKNWKIYWSVTDVIWREYVMRHGNTRSG